jgi:hypothetical protein
MSLYFPCYRPYNKHNTNIHALGGIRTHAPSKRAAVDPRLTPRGHWARHINVYGTYNSETRWLDYTIYVPINVQHVIVLTAVGDPNLH